MTGDLLLQAVINGITNGSIYALVGMGMAVIFKGSHVINAAQGDCGVLAAIAAVFLLTHFGTPYVVAGLAAAVVGAFVCAAIDLFFVRHMRRRGAGEEAYLLLTIAIALTLSAALLYFGGRANFSLPPVGGETVFVFHDAVLVGHAAWLVVCGTLLTLAITLFYRRTTLGLAMVAASIDPQGAATIGIDVPRMRTLTFAMGGVLGAIAAVLVAPLVALDFHSGIGLTLKGFAAAVLGGLTNPLGSIVGGLTIGLLEALAVSVVSSGYKDVIAFSVLIAVMLLLPNGMLGRAARKGG
jgi:branched-chain amino acid transport system permease protein